ncbi:hypothetical protein FSC02_11605 [Acinetobacter indicus]|uniref:Csu type fimbrial protein n=1 Tax=Acinetobacter indicus TaxID=756892 RepID=UPI0013B09746|nr:spore coat U domain-containing protein [Acinetobacter indicus]QIC79721.1 hypothetical protein FSC02_11605 [Acinetobacter indicus]
MKNFLTTALLASAGLILAGQANAATTSKTATADFKVKIEVLSTCAINATDIDFGSVNSAVAANDKTGALNVTCTSQTPYKVGLAGSGKMTHETDTSSSIAYQLFQNASDKSQWDNNSNLYSGVGSGSVQAIPVVAKVSGSTNVRAGKYIDTVTATVTY